MSKKGKNKNKMSSQSGKCSKCGKSIKNINRKLDIETPKGVVNCCCKECNDELTAFYGKYSMYKSAFIAQVVFGIAGIAALLMQYRNAAQIFIVIDAILFLVFPHAVFNPKFRASYDEVKSQSVNIGVSLLIFIAVWFYIFVIRAR